MADMPTPNSERLREVNDLLAAHSCGEFTASETALEAIRAERRKLLDHFAADRRCPTCGHRLSSSSPLGERAGGDRD